MRLLFILFLLFIHLGQAMCFQFSSDSLIAFYPFNGDARDESGNDYNGTVNGATLTTDRFGEANKAYEFDGTNDWISIGNVANLGTSDFTVAAWINIYSFQQNKVLNKGLTSVGTPPNSGYGLRNGYNFDEEIEFQLCCEGVSGNLTNYDKAQLNTWYYITGTRERENVSFFVNGRKVSNSKTAIIYNTDTDIPLAIGALDRRPVASVGEYFHGKIDDVRIYKRALSEQEITTLYHENCYDLNTYNEISINSCNDQPVTYNDQLLDPGSSSEFILTTKDGCDSTVRVSVLKSEAQFSFLGPDTSVCRNSLTLTSPNANTIWSNGSVSQSIEVTSPGFYTAEYIDMKGCVNRDSITVAFDHNTSNIYVPNVFSPNGDGLHDCFKPYFQDIETINSYSLKIYSRWGEIVFQTNNINDCWNGNFKNEMAIQGVYIWQISMNNSCNGKSMLNGSILIQR